MIFYQWDEDKDASNRRKHGLSFDTAKGVFEDPYHLSIQDRFEGAEERWQTMGMIDGVVLVLVAHTVSEQYGSEIIRIISARKATTHERRVYEESRY